MPSAVGYKLRVMELHCILERIGDHIAQYGVQIYFYNRAKASRQSLAHGKAVAGEVKGLCYPPDPLIVALVKLKDCVIQNGQDLLWMNYLSKKEAEAILKDYDPESVLQLMKVIPSKESILRYLDSASDLLLGLALQLSVPSQNSHKTDDNFSGLGIYPFLNYHDMNVELVLECLKDITSCVNCIQLIDQPVKGD